MVAALLLPAAGAVVGVGLASRVAFWWLTKKIAHILTGAQRRQLCPPDDHEIANGGCHVDLKGLRVQREVRTLKNGEKAFGQVIAPEGKSPTCVFVFMHGYSSHGDMYFEAACLLARRGAAVLMPDLPCHGRTDGLLCHVPDWWSWVEQVWEIVELFLPLAQEEGNGRPLKIFIGGSSLGGGLASCMCVQRPTFFQGLVLVAPMLVVSDEIKPPVVVQKIFRWIIAPLLPKWPIAPVKDLADFDFRVPSQGHHFDKSNAMSMQGLKARLGSACQFGFVFPDWMELQLKNVRTPLLIQHGELDKITDPALSRRLYSEAAATDKTFKNYEGAFHCELLSCTPGLSKVIGGDWLPEQAATTQRCLDDISEWLAERA